MLLLNALLVLSIPILVIAALAVRSLPPGLDCPACGAEALVLRARLLRGLSRLIPATILEKRWCPRCGWEGITRRQRGAAVVPSAPPEVPLPMEPGRRVEAPRRPDAGRAEDTRAIDLRCLSIHGLDWRVRLACTVEEGEWQGRLVFVAPTGKSWSDAAPLFRGSTAHGVIGQAVGAPQQVLTGRLRQLVSG